MTVNVRAVDFYWGDGFMNDPALKVLVDDFPESEWVYEKRPCEEEQTSAEQIAIIGARQRRKRAGWHIYFAEHDGFAWFFTWGGKPDDGFGGARRTIKLTDGTEEKIVGGWHVSPSVAKDAGFGEVIGITRHTQKDAYGDREWHQSGGMASFMTVERARVEVAKYRPDVEWVPNQFGGWTFKWRGQPSKAEHMRLEKERHHPLREALKAKYADPDRPWRSWSSKATAEELAELQWRPYSTLGPAEAFDAA